VYRDGVYIAAPILGPQLPTPSANSLNLASNDGGDGDGALSYKPHQAFTRRFLSLFKRQRKLLAINPPAEGFKRLPKAMKLTFPRGYKAGYASYMALTRNHNPSPVHLAALSQNSLLRMLGFATESLKRNRNIGSRQAAWLWGLMCRLGDVGTMDSEAVSIIRDLGKKAVWVGLGFFDSEAAKLTAEYSQQDDPISLERLTDDNHAEEWDDSPKDDDCGSEAMEISSSRGSVHGRNTAGPDSKGVELDELERSARNTSSPPSSEANCASPPPQDAQSPDASQVEAADLEAARARLLERIGADYSAEVGAEMCDGDEEELVEDRNEEYAGDHDPDQTEEHAQEPNSDCPDSNTRATLDMIITISGEVYGQRDLLEFREVWGGESGLWG
jgi:hypothetical protein